jgi:hypothetical protein
MNSGARSTRTPRTAQARAPRSPHHREEDQDGAGGSGDAPALQQRRHRIQDDRQDGAHERRDDEGVERTEQPERSQ